MSGNKDANTLNASWLEEQDWKLFEKKDLPVIETKVLKLEAEIASELKECNIIKSIYINTAYLSLGIDHIGLILRHHSR